jgi:hypothetical protein
MKGDSVQLVEYSQKQTFYCSLKFTGIVFVLLMAYIAIAFYFKLPIPSFFLLIPLIIGVMLIPLQALFFDWFQTRGKSLSLDGDDIIYKYKPNTLYSDTDEVERYSLNNIKKIKVSFENLSCFQGIKIEFKDNKKLYLLGFFIRPEELKKIKEYLIL